MSKILINFKKSFIKVFLHLDISFLMIRFVMRRGLKRIYYWYRDFFDEIDIRLQKHLDILEDLDVKLTVKLERKIKSVILFKVISSILLIITLLPYLLLVVIFAIILMLPLLILEIIANKKYLHNNKEDLIIAVLLNDGTEEELVLCCNICSSLNKKYFNTIANYQIKINKNTATIYNVFYAIKGYPNVS